jgi:hypothetical protein
MDDRMSQPAHATGTRKAEEMPRQEGKEPGRQDTGITGAGRPTGASTARDSTGINPGFEEPIDPNMPNLRTP